jgi:hypothetical protein
MYLFIDRAILSNERVIVRSSDNCTIHALDTSHACSRQRVTLTGTDRERVSMSIVVINVYDRMQVVGMKAASTHHQEAFAQQKVAIILVIASGVEEKRNCRTHFRVLKTNKLKIFHNYVDMSPSYVHPHARRLTQLQHVFNFLRVATYVVL